MLFQSKHYEAIANVLQYRTPKAKDEHRDHNDVFIAGQHQTYREGFLIMRDLAILFTDDNPNFALARWEVACGHEAGVIAEWIPGGMRAK